jgi:hypothetical protein
MRDRVADLNHSCTKWIVEQFMEGYSSEEVAAVLASQAMMIYKTVLDAEGYEKMTLAIYNSRQIVKKVELPDITLN